MYALSLTTLVEESSAEAKGLAGNIKSFEEVFQAGYLEALEKAYRYCAFLAFHPKTDTAVTDYVKQGTLASDSGPNMLTLFTLDAEATWPTPVTQNAFASWLEIDAANYPAYQMVRMLFEPQPVPALPGIVFFRSFSGQREALYVPLQGLSDAHAVQERLRALFALADEAVRKAKKPEDVQNTLAVALQAQRITFSRSSKTSMREWLIRGYQFVSDHFGDIVSVVGLLK